jgi:hypothetical protein
MMVPPTAVPVMPMVPVMMPIDLLYVRTLLRDANNRRPDGRCYHGQRQPTDYCANGDAAQKHFGH